MIKITLINDRSLLQEKIISYSEHFRYRNSKEKQRTMSRLADKIYKIYYNSLLKFKKLIISFIL